VTTPVLPTRHDLVTRRFGWFSSLTMIRARLYSAFGLVAATTVICSLIAFFVFTNIGETTTELVSRSIPTTVNSLRLAEETTSLVASVPKLMAAENEPSRLETAEEISYLLRNLKERIERLGTLDAGEKRAEIDTAQIALVERLDALDLAVTGRILVSVRRQTGRSRSAKPMRRFSRG
jgi:phosphoglycerate-specific signal transduction histidine kinase